MTTTNTKTAKRSTTKRTKKTKTATPVPRSEPHEGYVVGIGSSAGGLEALQALVKGLEPTGRLSYIVAQHLSPDHKSLMVELLSRATKLPVEFAKHNAEIRPDTIYVAPANADVTVSGRQLKLAVPANPLGAKPSINLLLTSLAEQYGDHAIGVILSGTGSDGAQGIKAIKAAGGITIAQKPETAKFDSMPKAAIATGGVDVVLPPEKIAEALRQLTSGLPKIDAGKARPDSEHPFNLSALIALIRDHTGYDFSLYKEATLQRQVARRMALHGIVDLPEYGAYLRQHPEEFDALVQSFLICVTGFLRDPDSFYSLRQPLRTLLEARRASGEFRVWVAGCATGEEAYTLAMLIDQELGDLATRMNVRIFATDINDKAIAVARRGEYSKDAVSELPPEWQRQYFREESGRYRVVERLRKQVLFSRHDVTRDPPFVRIDLISCRNLLIYFKPELQEKVLKLFHYAANPNALLLLGGSESIRDLDTLWAEVDGKRRIYRRREGVSTLPVLATQSSTVAEVRSKGANQAVTKERDYLEEATNRRLMELYLPPSVLVTREGSLLHFFGDCSRYLKLPRGRANLDLFSLVEAPLRAELRAGIQIALKEGEYRSAPLRAGQGDNSTWYRVVIRRHNVALNEPSDLLLVSFEAATPPSLMEHPADSDALEASAHQRLLELEEELQLTRERMQTVIEELETSNEELQALNEEAQAASEELQAANEELETANEELQASNEELVTLNEELEHRSAELERINQELESVLRSLDTAVLVLDRNLVVWRHNEAAERLFSFADVDGPPSLFHFKQQSALPVSVHESVLKVLETGTAQTFEFGDPEKGAFLARLTPFTMREKRKTKPDGVVLTIVDVTKIKEYEQKLELFAQVFENAAEGILVADAARRVVAANPSAMQILGLTNEALLGKPLPRIANLSDDECAALWDAVARDRRWRGELSGQRDNGEPLVLQVSLSALSGEAGEISGYVFIFSDVTREKQAMDKLAYHANYDSLTDLPNRNLLRDRVTQAILRGQRSGTQVALLFLDLDNFKLINDTLGHRIGDKVLVEIARRLQQSVRSTDTVGRLGGDEFVFVLEEVTYSSVSLLAEKVLHAVIEPIRVEAQEIRITASMGIALFPYDGADFDTLLKHADSAMYEAKRLGKNRYSFFTYELQKSVVRELWLRTQLASALEGDPNQIWVAYQPIVDARSGAVVGVEALMRWRHPDVGEIPPGDFIPVAERNGLIKPLALWVTRKALDEVETRNRNRAQPIGVSLNLSLAQHLDSAHFDALLALLEGHRAVAQGWVTLEITESMAIDHKIPDLIPRLERLRQVGCHLALDDFGTGYSSLSVLKQLPVQEVKIDASFVRDIETDPADEAMIKAIIDIARVFDLSVVVEGVENETQLEFVLRNGAHLVQGYYFSKPLSAEELTAFLHNH